MKKTMFYAILLLMPFWMAAQQWQVKGTVKDATDGEPLPGVAIKCKETSATAYTDINGKFEIRVPKGSTLVFMKEGYETKTVKADKKYLEVLLSPKSIHLAPVMLQGDPMRSVVHSVVVMDETKRNSQPRNAADLFADVPGFYIQKRSNTSLEPSLRAFKYEQMNIRLNGGDKIVNACPNRMDPMMAHVIPEDIRKIEVVKGPFTVRYGQTFGAVINMVTHQPRDYGLGTHGTLEGGYETNGHNKVARGELAYVAEKYDLGIEGEYRDFGDYVDGAGVLTPAGFKTTSYSVKAGYQFAENKRFYVDWHQKFGRDIKHAGLMMDSPIDDSHLLSLGYKAVKLPGKIKSVEAKAYSSYVDHLMTNGYLLKEPRPNYPAIDARTPVFSETRGGKVEIGWKPADKWFVYSGVDADLIHRDGTKTVIINVNLNTGQPLDPPIVKKMKVWQNACIRDFGIYSEAHKKLNDRWYWTTGARIDYVYSNAKDPDPEMLQIYGSVGPKKDIVPSVNTSFKYKDDDWRFEAAVGRGGRTPSMIERYIHRFIVGEDSREYIGNPHLRPEYNNQVEFYGQRDWDQMQLGVDVYASYFQDYIVPVITPSLMGTSGGCGGGAPKAPKQFRNVHAYQYGFDILFKAYLNDNWIFSADGSYIYAWNLSLGEPLAQVAPPMAHLGLKYTKDNYWVDLRSEWVAKQTHYAPSFGETPTPGHVKWDLRAGWRPNEHWSLGAAVLNLTNAAYYNHLNFAFRNADELNGRRIYEPGRNFSFYVKYKF